MSPRFSAAVLALAVFSAAHAAGDDKRRVLVADAVANGVDPSLARTLTSMIVARLDARPGVDALSGAELKRLMSLEADKAACGSDDCVNDLTGALGAPLAVFADVGKLGALTVVNLTLFDVVQGVPVARAAVETEKLEQMPDKLDAAVGGLLADASADGASTRPPSAKNAATKSASTAGASTTGAPTQDTASRGAAKSKHAGGASKTVAKARPSAPRAPTGDDARVADLLGDDSGGAIGDATGDAGGLGLRGVGGGGGGSGAGLGGLGALGRPVGEGAAGDAGRPLRPADVQTVVRSHRGELRACAQLARKSGKHGRVAVRFLIAGDGKVTFAHITRTDFARTGVGKCVIDHVSSWTFRATGAPTAINFPFAFR